MEQQIKVKQEDEYDFIKNTEDKNVYDEELDTEITPIKTEINTEVDGNEVRIIQTQERPIDNNGLILTQTQLISNDTIIKKEMVFINETNQNNQLLDCKVYHDHESLNEQCYKGFDDEFSVKKCIYFHNCTCKLCNTSLNKIRQFEEHILLHSKKPFECNICLETFLSKDSLKQHNHLCKCDICLKIFSTALHLQTHLSEHTRKGAFKCGMCDRSFMYPSQLKIHFAMHTGDGPFKCVICDISFLRKYRLKRHMLCHKNEIGY